MISLVLAAAILISPVDARLASSPNDDAPRVSTNQTRPSEIIGNSEQDPDPVDPNDPYGAQSCLKKHHCSGGSVCAAGSCSSNSEENGCKWCTGFKCKAVNCV